MDIAKSLFGNRPHEGYAGKEDYNVSWYSCRDLFKKLNILPLASELVLSLLSFVLGNMEKFQTNSDIQHRIRIYLHSIDPS
jgi:hypothetical protein